CGHALSLKAYPRKRKEDARYYICNTKYVSASCDGVGSIQADEIEDIVFDEMARKLREFNELSYKEKQGDPIEITKLKLRLEEIEKEINVLIDRVVSASTTTMEYINKRIDTLDDEKRKLKDKIAQLSAELYDRKNIGTISGYMDKWNEISMDDKLTVVDTLIESIHVDQGNVQISWKI
ncbi:MAG: zinc ribbon domain-containing protein, partial [Ruminococcus flavefaciens]|nr:zinc ribbon domain-containing protein [Ruminococcus flavefaciens]